MIYLYVKTHNLTKLKYLGKTTRNPYTYKGSGKYWLRHLKKHGNEITTEIIFESDDPNEIKKMGLYYSSLWDIVESEEWANLRPESGDGGDTSKFIDFSKPSVFKGKTYEDIYGLEKAMELKKSRSESNRKREKNPESYKKISETRKRLFKSGALKPYKPDPIKSKKLKDELNAKINYYRKLFIESNLSRKEFAKLHNYNYTTMKKYLRGL